MNDRPPAQGGAAHELDPAARKLPMTNWYSPPILIATALRVAVSTVFGQFTDRREAIAAANAIEPQPFDGSLAYEAAADGAFWFDYLADTGDGWNATYAMARLVSQDSIDLAKVAQLPRGKLLILGGDQVYPFASREAYAERFIAPFEEAYRVDGTPRWREGEHDLFAVPGNHDWYDGLNAFLGVFCRRRVKPASGIGFDRPGRVIAGRRTKQTRSYFAVKLPGGWWLWATDAQLEGYIDQPQIDYFRHVARYWMEKGSKVILCVDGPIWAYVDEAKPQRRFENFSYLERLAGAERDDSGEPMGHKLKLVLTGDSHHYARYREGERIYITCGGGGAFLHPTHQLEDKDFAFKYPPPGEAYDPERSYRRAFSLARTEQGEESLFPSRKESRTLSLWNFAFAAINYKFTATLMAAYFVFHWLLTATAGTSDLGSLSDAIGHEGLIAAAKRYWSLVFQSPTALLLALIAWGAYIYAAAARNWPLRLLTGTCHAAAQAAVVTLVTCAVLQALPSLAAPLAIMIAAAGAAIASATTYGLYLFIMLNAFGLHWNEGFSSFAHRGYKCMLRMAISKDGELTVYPVGLRRVPWDRGRTPGNPPLEPHLIEGPLRIV